MTPDGYRAVSEAHSPTAEEHKMPSQIKAVQQGAPFQLPALTTLTMALGLRRLLLAALLLVSCHLALSNARLVGKDELREKQKAAAERFSFSTLATASSANHKPPRKNITFSNPKAKSEFYCLLWIPRIGSCSWVG